MHGEIIVEINKKEENRHMKFLTLVEAISPSYPRSLTFHSSEFSAKRGGAKQRCARRWRDDKFCVRGIPLWLSSYQGWFGGVWLSSKARVRADQWCDSEYLPGPKDVFFAALGGLRSYYYLLRPTDSLFAVLIRSCVSVQEGCNCKCIIPLHNAWAQVQTPSTGLIYDILPASAAIIVHVIDRAPKTGS